MHQIVSYLLPFQIVPKSLAIYLLSVLTRTVPLPPRHCPYLTFLPFAWLLCELLSKVKQLEHRMLQPALLLQELTCHVVPQKRWH